MKTPFFFAAAAMLVTACGSAPAAPADAPEATVIEVATFQLKAGVAPAQFAPLDAAVETNHVSKQPGFVSRETGFTEQGEWLVIVHWESLEAAEASMTSFSSAAAAAEFMQNLDASTMSMIRYQIND